MALDDETWELDSGTWLRDPESEDWRLIRRSDELISPSLPSEDAAYFVRAAHGTSGTLFPPEFRFHPGDGTPLLAPGPTSGSWIPPFGSLPTADLSRPKVTGLRISPVAIQLGNSRLGFSDPAREPDRRLRQLPPGNYRFVVHTMGLEVPALIAIETAQGALLLFLPKSDDWVPIDNKSGALLAEAPPHIAHSGWRTECVQLPGSADMLFLPTARGLACLQFDLLALTYSATYVGDGPAWGGPVAWAGEVWIPVEGKKGTLKVIGKAPRDSKLLSLELDRPPPSEGFDHPVISERQIIWPAREGQLVLRQDADGKEEAIWLDWPDGFSPVFSLGCPYLSASGTFWQCGWNDDQSLEYIELGKAKPQRVAVDSPRIGTGRISFKADQPIKGDPWQEPEVASTGSAQVVLPLLELPAKAGVVALKVDAPRGVLEFLDSSSASTKQRVVLHLQADNSSDKLLGTLFVTRPLDLALFVFDNFLWAYHPDLDRPHGWALK